MQQNPSFEKGMGYQYTDLYQSLSFKGDGYSKIKKVQQQEEEEIQGLAIW